MVAQGGRWLKCTICTSSIIEPGRELKAQLEQQRCAREREALAEKYAAYQQTSANPVTFEQYVQLIRAIAEPSSAA